MQVSTGFRRSIATNLSRVALHTVINSFTFYIAPLQHCLLRSVLIPASIKQNGLCIERDGVWRSGRKPRPKGQQQRMHGTTWWQPTRGDNKFCLPSGDRHALRRNTAQPRMEGQDPHLKALSINVLRFNNSWQSLFTCGEPQF